jgi:LysM repeat protein
MLTNQLHKVATYRLAPVALGLALALTACTSWLPGHRGDVVEPGNTRVDHSADAAPEVAAPLTATEALGDLPAEETVVTTTTETVAATAPRSYVVQRGDTLWGLARMFLRDPWLWPEIWYVNPQVQNPHRIYPGDTLALARGSDGQMQLVLQRGPSARLSPMLRSTAIDGDGPIATIPYEAIRAFLSKPGLISNDELKRAPYVLSIRGNRALAGSDTDVYVRKLSGALNQRFNVMHISKQLKDPDGGGKLGYMAVFAGTAQLSRAGEPATAHVLEAAREVLKGDVLLTEGQNDISAIVPHSPTRDVKGHIIGVVSGVNMVGQYQVVAVNRGSNHGMDVGTVLRVREADKMTRDTCVHINNSPTCRKWSRTDLPNESVGVLLVFKIAERMSYALVVNETDPITVGQRIGNP